MHYAQKYNNFNFFCLIYLKDTFKQSFKQIEELKDIVSDNESEGGIEIEDVTIKISEPKEDVNKKFIGLRRFEESASEQESDEGDTAQDDNKILGMEMDDKTEKSRDNQKELPKHLKDIKSEKDFKKMVSLNIYIFSLILFT